MEDPTQGRWRTEGYRTDRRGVIRPSELLLWMMGSRPPATVVMMSFGTFVAVHLRVLCPGLLPTRPCLLLGRPTGANLKAIESHSLPLVVPMMPLAEALMTVFPYVVRTSTSVRRTTATVNQYRPNGCCSVVIKIMMAAKKQGRKA